MALNIYLPVGHCNYYIAVSVVILLLDVYFIRVDFYFRLELYFSNDMKKFVSA